MAIAFSCSCGKTMKAKEAYAGRKVRCPQCDGVVTIPQTATDEEELATTPRPAEPAAPVLAKPRGEEDLAATPVPAEPAAPLHATPVVRPSFPRAKDSAEPERRPTPPPAKQVAPPADSERKAEPAARPALVHAWVDQSLAQRPTPWLPGDEARFQRGIKPPREGMSGLEIGVLGFLVLAGAAAAGWFLIGRY